MIGGVDHSIRVVHLIDPVGAGDEAVLACVAATTIGVAEHTVVLVGDTAAERRAWSLGLNTVDRVNPAGSRLLTARRVARLVRARLEGETRPTVLNAWSAESLYLARRAMGKRAMPRVGVLVSEPEAVPRHVHEYGMDEATLLALSPVVREAVAPAASVRRGGTLVRDNIRLAPPPAMPRGGPVSAERSAVRQALGLEASDRVVSLLADPPARGDALAMAFQLGLCFTIGRPLIGLVPKGAANIRQAIEFCREHGRRWQVVPVDLTLPEIVATADVCIVQINDGRPSSGPTALGVAASMGVPVAAHASALAGLSRVAPPPPALLARNDDRNALAVPIVALIERDDERSRIVHEQRAWGDAARPADAFRSTLAAIWAEVANLPMRREGLPVPTALAGAGA